MINNHAIDAELLLRSRNKTGLHLTAPEYWQDWCKQLFPKHFNKPFAQRHIELWEWAEAIQVGVKPKAFIGIWGRGGAKSTNAETIVVRLGAKKIRTYGWYVSSTQAKADQHVANIGALLENKTFASYYSKMSRRAVNQYGTSKGWKRNRLFTADKFIVDAFGMDTGLRGAKIEDSRPDFIVIDDIDELGESLPVILKKERILTDTVFPSGSSDCAILFIQNLIHPESIASRIVDGRADYLRNRILSGPFPAIDGLAYEIREHEGSNLFFITGGTSTWDGQPIETCQEQINEWGISAFLREAQHEVELTGGMWDHIQFMYKTWEEIQGQIIDIEIWVDPAVTSTDNSDCQGISAGASIGQNKMVFFYWWEGIDSPHNTMRRAILKGLEFGASAVGVETDNGGDVWKSAYELAAKEIQNEMIGKWKEENPNKSIDEMPKIIIPRFKSDKAGKGHGSKTERNQRMLASYERGEVFHVIGTHNTGEKALRRFDNPPLDLADSMYYTWFHLIGKKKLKLHVRTA